MRGKDLGVACPREGTAGILRGMENNKFIMLGTIHRDVKGPEALACWLEALAPDVVTFEFSNYGLRFRQVNGDRLRRRLCRTMRDLGFKTDDGDQGPLQPLFDYIGLPYEFTAVSGYAQKAGIPFYLVDMDLFSRLKLREMDMIVGRKNVEALLDAATASPESTTSPEKVLAELFFRQGIKTYRYTDEMRIRDNFMKNRISLLMRHHGPGRFLHVCGWQHLPDPYDIYRLLNPIKVFMYDRTFRI